MTIVSNLALQPELTTDGEAPSISSPKHVSVDHVTERHHPLIMVQLPSPQSLVDRPNKRICVDTEHRTLVADNISAQKSPIGCPDLPNEGPSRLGASDNLHRPSVGRVKKRKGYQLTLRGRETRLQKRHIASQTKLARRLTSMSSAVPSRTSYLDLPKSTNGVSGSRTDALQQEIDLLCGDLGYRLAELKTFRPIAYQ